MNTQQRPSSYNSKVRKHLALSANNDRQSRSSACLVISCDDKNRNDDDDDRSFKRARIEHISLTPNCEATTTTTTTTTPVSPVNDERNGISSSIGYNRDDTDQMRRDGPSGCFSDMSSNSSCEGVPDASCCDQLKRNLLLPYDYDEGMNDFIESTEIPLHDHLNDVVKSSITMYNVGLSHCKGSKTFDRAEKWFQMALTTIEQVTTEQIISYKIMRCLGFCFYRQYRFQEAYGIFQKARQCLNEINLPEFNETTPEIVTNLQYIASIKNAIAMSLFHSPKEKNMNLALELLHDSLDISTGLHCNNKNDNTQRQFIATSLNNIGRIYFSVRDYTKARQAFSASLKMKKLSINSSDGMFSVTTKVTLYNLAQTCHQLQLFNEAKELYLDFVQINQKSDTLYVRNNQTINYNQRDYAIVYSKLGHIYAQDGNYATAREMYEQGLHSARIALRGKVFRIRSELASILNILGTLCYKMKDLPAALRYIQEGFEVETLLVGSTCHPNAIISLMNIAQIHRDLNNFSSAFAAYEHAYKVQIRQGCTTSTSSTLFNMGLMMHRMKLFGQALCYYQQALTLQTLDDIEGSASVGATLNSIGIVLFHIGKKESAKKYFEQSLTMRRKFLGPYHADVPVTLFNLAMVYLEANDEETASDILKETLRVERTALGPKCYESVQTLQHLGFSLQVRGELNEALVCFEDALEIDQEQYGKDHIRVGKLLNYIGNIHLQRGNVTSMMQSYIAASRINMAHNEPLAIAGYNFYCLSKLFPECAGVA